MKIRKIQKTISLLIVSMVLAVFLTPVSVSASNAKISVKTEQDSFNIGDEFAATFQIDTEDQTISSVDLIFSYDPEVLELKDEDLQTAGIQLNTSSSSFSTITKKIADSTTGEMKITGSKIGGVTGEGIIFIAIFKVLKAENTTIYLDNAISKIFDEDGLSPFDYTPKNIEISQSNEENTDENVMITLSHQTPAIVNQNESLNLILNASPQSKVKEARLYFKNSLLSGFTPLKMTNSSDDTYAATIPAEDVVIGTFSYFFGVIDLDDNPHRYPESDNEFYTIDIQLNSSTSTDPTTDTTNTDNLTNDALYTPPASIDTTPAVTIPGDYKGGATSYQNSDSTSQTGPKTNILIIATTIIAIYIAIKDNGKISKKNENLV